MTRTPLPNRRQTDTSPTTHYYQDGTPQELIIGVGRDPETGKIAEVFIDVPWNQAKTNIALIAKDASVLISIALQSGTDLATLAAAMGRSEVSQMGSMNELPHTIIGTALDYMVKLDGP